MNTEWIKLLPEQLENDKEIEAIKKAGQVIKNGGLVAFPTETVYGLGGDALNAKSSEKIYAAKGRPSDNPLIVHIAKLEDLSHIVKEIPKTAKVLANHFWPGPLTMIFEKNDKVPYETTGGLDTVAVRLPDDPVAIAFIEAAGGYIAAPSANTSGRPSPTCGKHVYEDMQGKIEMILDSGNAGIGLESTIVDLTGEIPVILRPGFVTEEMLEKVLGKVDMDQTILSVASGMKPKAPGMKYKHYAPKGELSIVSGDSKKVVDYINNQILDLQKKGMRVGVIATEEMANEYVPCVLKNIGSRKNEAEIARNLYEILREFDEMEVQVMFSEAFEAAGMGQAIMNRLLKAAGHHVVEL